MKHGRVLLTILMLTILFSSPPSAQGGKGGGKPGDGGGDPPASASPEILYSSYDRKSGRYDIMVMDADGASPTRLVKGAGDTFLRARWSPDGTRIVFNGTLDGYGIYVADADGSNVVKVASTTLSSTFPVWSPLTTTNSPPWILFHDSGRGPNLSRTDLFCVRADGSGLGNITDSEDRAERYVSCSSDGSTVAASVGDSSLGRTDVLVFGVTETSSGLSFSSESNLTNRADSPLQAAGGFGMPDWARGTDRIAVCVFDLPGRDNSDAWVISLSDPDNPEIATGHTSILPRMVTWSPDDGTLAFWGTGSGRSENGILTVSGTDDPVQIAAGNVKAPDWKR